MLHLLHIEWLKLNRYKAFILLSILFVISIFGFNYLFDYQLSDSFSDPMASNIVGTPYSFPYVWRTVSYMSSFLLFIPGMLIILLMNNEYSYKTNRQNIIDGVSRMQFIGTKILLIVLFSLLLTLIVALTAFIFGSIGNGSFSFSGFKYVCFFGIQAALYLSVAMLFALLFKRSAVSIGVYFLYIFILENLLAAISNNYLKPLGDFFPLESSDKLIPAPSFLGQLMPIETGETTLLIVSGLWLVLCLGLCVRIFTKSDL